MSTPIGELKKMGERHQQVARNKSGELKVVRPTSSLCTAEELMAREFPEPRWAVPGILPEGSVVFAGRPKLGKSWAALDIAVAVAAGGRAFGTIKVEKRNVLYLGLEDGFRRLQDRLRRTLAGEGIPKGLLFDATWPRFDEGGLEAIQNWIKTSENPGLVVIDTLKRVRPVEHLKERLYNSDYDAVAPLGDMMRDAGVCGLLVHHTRKQDSDDPIDLVSGSLGLTGAVDGIWVLKRARGQCDATLHASGRDFEDQEIALRWDAEITGWRMLGDASEYRLSNERREVIALLRQSGPLAPKAASELLGRTPSATKKLLWTMHRDGDLHADEKGRYSVTVSIANGNPTVTQKEAVLQGNNGLGYRVTTVTGVSEEHYFPPGGIEDLEARAIRDEGNGLDL